MEYGITFSELYRQGSNLFEAKEIVYMRGSFQDQLLKLGLVEKQKAQDAKKEQYQSRKQQTGKEQSPKVDENALLAEAAQQKKRERAHQLNLERE